MNQLTPTAVIGKRIRKLRGSMSAQALADRCAELGMPGLKRQAITNLENGRRGMVTVEEWFVLARALNVPLISLLISDGGRPLTITPQFELYLTDVAEWLVGAVMPPAVMRGDLGALREWAAANTQVRLLEEFRTAVSYAGNAASFPDEDRDLNAALSKLADVANRMIESGLTPPPLPRSWVERMRKADLLRYPDQVAVEPERA